MGAVGYAELFSTEPEPPMCIVGSSAPGLLWLVEKKADGMHLVERRRIAQGNGTVNDIAIYELMSPVAYSTFVCLANEDLPFKKLTNYGYGTTGLEENQKEPYILKKRDVKYVDCQSKTLNGRKCEKYAAAEVTLACGGDSGGPVVAEYYDRIFSVGVLIGGPDCSIAEDWSQTKFPLIMI